MPKQGFLTSLPYRRERFDMNGNDPWLQIVSSLGGQTLINALLSRKPIVHRSLERCKSTTSAMANAVSILRIEWQTNRTILISWSDATLGRYEDQTWRAGLAYRSGICGLTGAPVRRGDAVF